MYIYHITLYKKVAGMTVQDVANTTDFETNYKSQVVSVDAISLNETTFTIVQSYTQFKALITGDILWSDVKMIDDGQQYKLNLLIAT